MSQTRDPPRGFHFSIHSEKIIHQKTFPFVSLSSFLPCIVICVNGFAEVNSIFEFFPQNFFGRVSWHFEEEETGVGLWQEVIRWIVFVQNLYYEMEIVFI